MIDKGIFAMWMGVIADRWGRELKVPTLRVYWELLSEHLDTDAFALGCKRVVFRSQFFPSPWDIVEATKPTPGEVFKLQHQRQLASQAEERLQDRYTVERKAAIATWQGVFPEAAEQVRRAVYERHGCDVETPLDALPVFTRIAVRAEIEGDMATAAGFPGFTLWQQREDGT